MIIKFLTAAAAVGLASPAYGVSQDTDGSVDGMSRAQIETIVREFIMENPEVLLESVNAFSERRRQATMASLLSDGGGYVAGTDPASARIAVVELFDYHCGYCKTASPVIRDILESDPDVKVVFRELPILREESVVAAEYALAAREQDEYVDLHFALMNAKGVLTEERIEEIAASVGLDVDKARRDRKSLDAQTALAQTRSAADALGVTGTPAIIVMTDDGSFSEMFSGWTEAGLREAIAAAKASLDG